MIAISRKINHVALFGIGICDTFIGVYFGRAGKGFCGVLGIDLGISPLDLHGCVAYYNM